jgi:hypothetical protein
VLCGENGININVLINNKIVKEMKKTKDFKCNYEELPAIGGFVSFNLKRDLSDFTAFSSKFDEKYVTDFDTDIKKCSDLVIPKEETAKLKVITSRMYSTMDSLIGQVNSLEIYIKMAETDIPISVSDFGIPALRKSVHRRDAEAVIQNLHILRNSVQQYKTELSNQGLSDNAINLFTTSAVSIQADNQKQYEIVTNRKELVQTNIELFNGLYAKIMRICNIGKAIYKDKDEKKVKDYTFSALLKQVRVVFKRDKDTNKEDNTSEEQ